MCYSASQKAASIRVHRCTFFWDLVRVWSSVESWRCLFIYLAIGMQRNAVNFYRTSAVLQVRFSLSYRPFFCLCFVLVLQLRIRTVSLCISAPSTGASITEICCFEQVTLLELLDYCFLFGSDFLWMLQVNTFCFFLFSLKYVYLFLYLLSF